MNPLAGVRSLLFVPADDERKLAKAFRSAADAVIADLEDGVAPARKELARRQLRSLARIERPPLRMVRIAAGEPLDLDAIAALELDAVVVAKANPDVLAALGAVSPPLIALIETARGLRETFDIAAHPQVAALMLGSLDLTAELQLRRRPDGAELLLARSTLVLASAVASLRRPFDGVHPGLADSPEFLAEIELARDVGLGGKACIHPRQVIAINNRFRPSAAECDWARAVVRTYEEARAKQEGVSGLNGTLVDRPVYLRAVRLLEEAEG
jgi:citrate lyase beta subunit